MPCPVSIERCPGCKLKLELQAVKEKRAKEEEEAARIKEEELARSKDFGKTRKPRNKAKYAGAAVPRVVDEYCDPRSRSSEVVVNA